MQKIQQSGFQVNGLYTPKPFVEPEDKKPPEGVVVWRFPGWSLTQKTRQLIDAATSRTYQARLLVPPGWIDRSNGKADLPDWDRKGDNKKYDIVPIRFIRACEAGHMDDIDWRGRPRRRETALRGPGLGPCAIPECCLEADDQPAGWGLAARRHVRDRASAAGQAYDQPDFTQSDRSELMELRRA